MSFSFSGDLDISKSWMNRALILQSYQPEIEILGTSESDDVKLLQTALQDFKTGKNEFYAGLGGTTFRFLALRLSRQPGVYKIKAEKKLFERPQTELISILKQLGITAFFNSEKTEFIIDGQGWRSSADRLLLEIDSLDSSQFLSSVLLNSLGLPFDLVIKNKNSVTSESYFTYTIEMMKSLGVVFENNTIIKDQKLSISKMTGEVDVSSFFSIAAAAILAGKVRLTNWNSKSLQPDMKFVEFFTQMQIQYQIEGSNFLITKQNIQKPLKANLANCPDLFPVLSVLCAVAPGDSHLFGATQLIHKESNRITKTYELLNRCGFQCEIQNDGLKIHGMPDAKYYAKDLIHFNPDGDHRMAFAATLLKLKGFPVLITDPDVINKSYPQFYQHLDLGNYK